MDRIKLAGRLIIMSAFALTLVFSTSPASAHSSGYCGHGTSGWADMTEFTSSYTNYSLGHMHVYRHWNRVSGFTNHYAETVCNNNVGGGGGSW